MGRLHCTVQRSGWRLLWPKGKGVSPWASVGRLAYLLVAVGDVPDFIPWERDLGGQPVFRVIDV